MRPSRPREIHRALITGGAGLIGSHVADLLARSGTEVVVYDNLSRGRVENLAGACTTGRVTIVRGDVRDRPLLIEAMREVEVIFHLAAIRMPQCVEQPRLAFEVMAEGAFNVAEAAVASGVPRVVAASSASIYGMADRFPTPEEHHPYNNTTLYGAAKIFNEGLLASFRATSGLDSVVLRPCHVYGPRMAIDGPHTEFLVRWMERIAAGLNPIVFGDGTTSMDLVFVEDVARAFLLAASCGASGDVFNIGSGVETDLAGIARALIRAMDADVDVDTGPPVPTPVPRRFADISKARAQLGFVPQVGLEDGLRRLVEWWRLERRRAAVAAG